MLESRKAGGGKQTRKEQSPTLATFPSSENADFRDDVIPVEQRRGGLGWARKRGPRDNEVEKVERHRTIKKAGNSG